MEKVGDVSKTHKIQTFGKKICWIILVNDLVQGTAEKIVCTKFEKENKNCIHMVLNITY